MQLNCWAWDLPQFLTPRVALQDTVQGPLYRLSTPQRQPVAPSVGSAVPTGRNLVGTLLAEEFARRLQERRATCTAALQGTVTALSKAKASRPLLSGMYSCLPSSMF